MSTPSAAIQAALGAAALAAQRYAVAVPAEARGRGDGRWLGSRGGRSQDFRDFRDYHPGDDLRWVDWAAYARSDRLTVRVFQEEICPHVDIVLDTSRSMDLEGSPKAPAAAGLAAFLAVAAANAGLTVTVWSDRDGLQRHPGQAARPETWLTPAFTGCTGLDEALRLQAPTLRRQGLRFLVSDLLWPGPPEEVLQTLAAEAAALHVLQVLASADLAPDAEGFLQVVDAETGQALEIFLDDDARRQVAGTLDAHRAAWADACRRRQAHLHAISADDLVRDWRPVELLRRGVLEGV
ncbi:MAG: DUF58 domain-containing protein [Lentisphaerae bacterium]|nr:DUF58 domain-containing protein [Lentisphaerota bacterium]